jgi:hypothetical protein
MHPARSTMRLSEFTLAAPGDADYDALRTPWNLTIDQRPAFVARPRSANQIAETISFAQSAGLRVTMRGGGHNAGPLGDLSDTVLIRTDALTGVTIDPVRRRARVEAGALWDHVVPEAARHGLAALHGSSPDVGVVGYSLTGGLGWLARRHGLQSSRIHAVELVTADGEFVRADAQHETDLFWALRGGGGSFGAVTALEFDLLPLTHAYAGWLAWDWRHSERVLKRWVEWTADAPEHVTTAARILQLPNLPSIPAPLRGRRLVAIDGAVLGNSAAIAPLRELAPEIDTFEDVPAETLTRLHADPEEPVPAVTDSAMLGPLDAGAIEAFVDVAGPGSCSTLLLAELRQLGGAVARSAADAGALAALDGSFILHGGALALDAYGKAHGEAHARRLVRALEPWVAGRPYANFSEHPTDASTFFAPETYARLQAIKTTVDPNGLFRANHDISRTGA